MISQIRTLLIATAFSLGLTIPAHAQKHLEKGEKMPTFSLTDQNGKTYNIADQVGKHKLVIYFYPKDESMVCTKEACGFRDMFDDFAKAGAIVIGINGGTVASHKAFVDHYKLPFVLLSDTGDKVYKMFGVKNKLFMSGRETFIVDLNGTVVYTHAAMLEGKAHADAALAALKAAK
ncbi:peroxiredoxin [Mucilaginibacter psychrotolerans]|uniref:thioredoxin-dependent peroxiredoxin n=1 Tax=Mucilaginibacter psychrotolerans TaxID=1524096 RepID=A0A4Y8SBW3_9SPHI|nr:peroxiredoxin [Mucilaginibacter psychrotolerans]TFF36539.1 peroxiredoxin [Mucilaginibacter psychrotolerans]